jgi:endo-1,4-beta-xylanase
MGCADRRVFAQYSWIPSQYPGEGEACLFDRNFNKKPAYNSVLSLLQSAASAGVRGSATAMPATVTKADLAP